MSKFKEQRVGILVDIQNMYYSARVLYQKKTNFKSILEAAVADRKLIRAIGYGIATEEKTEEKFFESLEKHGYEVKSKDLQIFKGGMKKGDWDVGISIDAIKLAKNLDVIVLVSGDGDYIPLVKYLQYNFGVRVEVMAFVESCSSQLIEEADDFTNLSEGDKFFVKDTPRKRTLKGKTSSQKASLNKKIKPAVTSKRTVRML
ncbi:NYN domain-containing protein [bacterium]|jgi:uncharacterized LabA/DUF88 family protein|nr:NYN domain-containing protein [bacterium]MBT4250946.1 NYN domain-containing protein [bacterium]MBT4597866.1 NYN domain-containing protein [bacterium]MBT6753942.1 NYN domain-containing protein [bacterium]MBT7037371.1 NYN domain-containing protein [bacterium]